MSIGEGDSVLRCYPLNDGKRSGWAVSGPSSEAGRRWRRVFLTREEAEAFGAIEREKRGLNQLLTEGTKPAPVAVSTSDPVGSDFEVGPGEIEQRPKRRAVTQRGRRSNSSRRQRAKGTPGYWLRRAGLLLLLLVSAFGAERAITKWFGSSSSGRLLSADFETAPQDTLWVGAGSGAEWTDTEHVSGSHSLLVRDVGWTSPVLRSRPLQWYSLKFRSKAPDASSNPGSNTYGRCVISYYSSAGNRLPAEYCASVLPSGKWQINDLRFRAHAIPDGGGKLVPVGMKVSFIPIGARRFYVDDVLIEETSLQEVAQWADRAYAVLPARLNYRPKETRWQHIPMSMQKLRLGQQLRILFLGDEVQQDLANTPIDVFLQTLYPGPRPEVVASIKPGGGVQDFKDMVEDAITKWVPDLVIVGGNSNKDEKAAFQQLIDEVKASDMQTGRATEVLLVTHPWSPNSQAGNFLFAEEMRELDQKVENNPAVPDDYRGHLLEFSAANRIEFLDMTGIASEFVFGPAAIARMGPSSGAKREPFSVWMRNADHPNESGRQIMGRILEAYFSPSGARKGNTR